MAAVDTARRFSGQPDSLFECLAADDRRRILRLVGDCAPEGLSAGALAASLVQSDDEGRLDEGTMQERIQRKQVALHHRHLPKLADHGYIDWTPGSDSISTGPSFDQIERVLELVEHQLESS